MFQATCVDVHRSKTFQIQERKWMDVRQEVIVDIPEIKHTLNGEEEKVDRVTVKNQQQFECLKSGQCLLLDDREPVLGQISVVNELLTIKQER